jgi:transcription termination factor Rho
VNIAKSGTRKEELLYHPDETPRIHMLRRAMSSLPPVEGMELLLERLKKTKNNVEFLLAMNLKD